MGEGSEFGRYLRALRERAALTLRDLGELSGVNYSYIGQLERGYNRRGDTTIPVNNPGWDIVKALADALATAPPGLTAPERRQFFSTAGHDEDRPKALAKRLGLTPEVARELARLPAGDLFRVLEAASNLKQAEKDTGVGIRFRKSRRTGHRDSGNGENGGNGEEVRPEHGGS